MPIPTSTDNPQPPYQEQLYIPRFGFCDRQTWASTYLRNTKNKTCVDTSKTMPLFASHQESLNTFLLHELTMAEASQNLNMSHSFLMGTPAHDDATFLALLRQTYGQRTLYPHDPYHRCGEPSDLGDHYTTEHDGANISRMFMTTSPSDHVILKRSVSDQNVSIPIAGLLQRFTSAPSMRTHPINAAKRFPDQVPALHQCLSSYPATQSLKPKPLSLDEVIASALDLASQLDSQVKNESKKIPVLGRTTCFDSNERFVNSIVQQEQGEYGTLSNSIAPLGGSITDDYRVGEIALWRGQTLCQSEHLNTIDTRRRFPEEDRMTHAFQKETLSLRKDAFRPKQPLSAYNIFFSEERLKLIRDKKSACCSEVKAAEQLLSMMVTNEPFSVVGDDFSVATRSPSNALEAECDRVALKSVAIEFPPSRSRKRKNRAEPHGVSFAEMGQIIGAKWKRLNPQQRKYYQDLADQHRERYHQERDDFEQHRTRGFPSDVQDTLLRP